MADFLSDIGGFVSGLPSEIWSGVQDLGGLAKQALTPGTSGNSPLGGLLGLAGAGGNLYSTIQANQNAAQQMKMQKQAQKQAMTATAPLRTAGQALVTAGQTGMMGGALPPNWEAQIQQTKAQRLEQVRQMLANMGITDSTTLQQMEMQVDAEMLNLRNQIASQLAQTGESEISAGVAPLGGVASSAGQNAAGITNSVAQAQAAINKLLGRQDPNQPTTTTP